MGRLIAKILAWLAILLGLALLIQPTAAQWWTSTRNAKTAAQFAARAEAQPTAPAAEETTAEPPEPERAYPELYAAMQDYNAEIYVGPALLKSLSGKLGRTACVVISLLLAGASVLILNIDLPLVIVLVSVALLGLFDGFGTPATSDYYVNMPAVRKAGVSQGLAMLNVVGSIVQTFSPVLYSAILAGGNAGTNIMGFSFIAAAVLFIVTLRMDAEKKQRSGSLNQ